MNRNSNANHEVHDKHKPAFLITIDTEGDNLWARPRTITTQNARSLPRFQSLCESYGLRPTYLVNYEMANSRAFQEFGKDILRRNAGEIGLHVHAWNTPPLVPLTEDDFVFQPYLIEYPQDVMRAKIAVTTDLLEDTFGVKVVSHRAGRWSFNETYARILVEKGYRVDCSVTPHVSWRDYLGDPKQGGGTDYSHFPDQAYFLDLLDISRPGNSPLLELPMTIVSTQIRGVNLLYQVSRNCSIAQRAWECLFRPSIWLRPNGKNLRDLLWIMRLAIRERRKFVEFMLHSSELMPGGSPAFPRDQDIEALYADLQVLFATVKGSFYGATLREYHQILTRDSMNRMPEGE